VLASESEENEFQMNFCQHDIIIRIIQSVKIKSVFRLNFHFQSNFVSLVLKAGPLCSGAMSPCHAYL